MVSYPTSNYGETSVIPYINVITLSSKVDLTLHQLQEFHQKFRVTMERYSLFIQSKIKAFNIPVYIPLTTSKGNEYEQSSTGAAPLYPPVGKPLSPTQTFYSLQRKCSAYLRQSCSHTQHYLKPFSTHIYCLDNCPLQRVRTIELVLLWVG